MIPEILGRAFQYAYFQSWNKGLWIPADRKFLIQEIFPFFASRPNIQRALFVGVHNYTRSYETYFENKIFVSIDCDQSQRKYGATRHFVADICDFQTEKFDLIFLNGVIGFGLNESWQVERAVRNMAELLNPNGWLVLGTNPKTFTAEMKEIFHKNFDAAIFPPTSEHMHNFCFPFSSAQHDYRFFRIRR